MGKALNAKGIDVEVSAMPGKVANYVEIFAQSVANMFAKMDSAWKLLRHLQRCANQI